MSSCVARSLLLALALAGCGSEDAPECAAGALPADLAGTWVVSGSGEWSDCSEEQLDGELTLRSPAPLTVEQAQGAGGDSLHLVSAVVLEEGSFSFSGTVRGRCVSFSTVETHADGSLSLDFNGKAGGSSITGSFSGSGPGGCRASGDFEAGVTLRDDCLADPCQNGGTCVDGPYGFTCECAAGFVGTICDDVDGCAGAPCYPGVVCTDVPNPDTGFSCGACPRGTTGDGIDCADVDGCAGAPCFPGVTCTDVPAPGEGFDCGPCPAPFTGDGIQCACPAGWTGPTCEEVDNCYPPPCRNGATCVDGDGTFTCVCGSGFTGDDCSEDIDECASAALRCDTHATCTNTFGSYECSCNPGYGGDGHQCALATSIEEAVSGCAASAGSPLVFLALLWGARRRRARC